MHVNEWRKEFVGNVTHSFVSFPQVQVHPLHRKAMDPPAKRRSITIDTIVLGNKRKMKKESDYGCKTSRRSWNLWRAITLKFCAHTTKRTYIYEIIRQFNHSIYAQSWPLGKEIRAKFVEAMKRRVFARKMYFRTDSVNQAGLSRSWEINKCLIKDPTAW